MTPNNPSPPSAAATDEAAFEAWREDSGSDYKACLALTVENKERAIEYAFAAGLTIGRRSNPSPEPVTVSAESEPDLAARREAIAEIVAACCTKMVKFVVSQHNGACLDAADAILALLALPVRREGWLPIESAPRDGTLFWAYERGRGAERRQFIAWWGDDRDGGFWQDDGDSEPEPTHYRPLPAPPSIASGETK